VTGIMELAVEETRKVLAEVGASAPMHDLDTLAGLIVTRIGVAMPEPTKLVEQPAEPTEPSPPVEPVEPTPLPVPPPPVEQPKANPAETERARSWWEKLAGK